MAGDWIKWVKGLANRAEVVRMAGMLSLPREVVACRCMMFWEWCDENISDSDIRENGSAFAILSPRDGDNVAFIDAHVWTPGFAEALSAVDWLRCRDGRIELPNFGRHNGETAKTRARNSKSQKKKRSKSKADDDKPRHQTVTNMSPSSGDILMTRVEERESRGISSDEEIPIGRKRFRKPSIAEVAAYCQERENFVDPEAFVNHYESNGWKIGKSAMKDWQAAVRNWEAKHKPPASRVPTAEDLANYNPIDGGLRR